MGFKWVIIFFWGHYLITWITWYEIRDEFYRKRVAWYTGDYLIKGITWYEIRGLSYCPRNLGLARVRSHPLASESVTQLLACGSIHSIAARAVAEVARRAPASNTGVRRVTSVFIGTSSVSYGRAVYYESESSCAASECDTWVSSSSWTIILI